MYLAARFLLLYVHAIDHMTEIAWSTKQMRLSSKQPICTAQNKQARLALSLSSGVTGSVVPYHSFEITNVWTLALHQAELRSTRLNVKLQDGFMGRPSSGIPAGWHQREPVQCARANTHSSCPAEQAGGGTRQHQCLLWNISECILHSAGIHAVLVALLGYQQSTSIEVGECT